MSEVTETTVATEIAVSEHAVQTPEKLPMKWYSLRVGTNMEDRVRDAIERKIKINQLEDILGKVIVPTQKERKLKGGKTLIVSRKIYPGYVFVEMQVDKDGRIPEKTWFAIKETQGAGDFISCNNKPSPLTDKDVEQMMTMIEKGSDNNVSLNITFSKGDRVRIADGAFKGFEGAINSIDKQKGIIKVAVVIFGRDTDVEIEYNFVEKV